MHGFLRVILVLFLLTLFVCSIAFALANTTAVPLSLGLWRFAAQPVAVWIIAAFCVGGVLGLLLGSGLFRGRRAQRRVAALERELARRQVRESGTSIPVSGLRQSEHRPLLTHE